MINKENSYSRRITAYAFIAVFAVSVILYLPSLGNDFVNMDDHSYVRDNPAMKMPLMETAQWAFGESYKSLWAPLTWISFRVDYMFWGTNPLGYHLTNNILNAFNGGIVFLVVLRLLSFVSGLDDRKAFGAALLSAMLFAVHPMHVESVAWISERKDVLYSFFFLLTVLVYLRNRDNQASLIRLYALALPLFALALLSKPMAVTLPFVLIVMDIYPLGRMERPRDLLRFGIYEKIPFYALSAGAALMTLLAHGEKVKALDHAFLSRLASASKGLAFYLIKAFVPANLVPFYPLPFSINPLSPVYLASYATIIFVTISSVWLYRRRPYFLAVWAYFVISLFPVLGFLDIAEHAYADRFIYLPILGPAVIVSVFVIKRMDDHRKWIRKLTGILILLTAILFSSLTLIQIGIWKNSLSMWECVRKSYPEHHRPYTGIGQYYASNGMNREAVKNITRAIRILEPFNTGYSRTLNEHNYAKRAELNFLLGDFRQSADDYTRALSLGLENADYYFNRAISESRLGNEDAAEKDYIKAIEIRGGFAAAYNNLGIIYFNRGNLQRAFEFFESATRHAPDRADYYYKSGMALENMGNTIEALRRYRTSALMGHGGAAERLNAHE